jgi:hypothetical protein
MINIINIDEIDEIVCIPRHLRRRIKKEYQLICDKYDESSIKYDLNGKVYISFTISNTQYIFNICTNYPFTAPKAYINGKSHSEFFRLPSNRFINILQYVSGLDCFCCNSLLCTNNWRCAITLEKVINQLEEYKTIKYNIVLKLLADKIKEQYLHRDIDLDSWLFTIYIR